MAEITTTSSWFGSWMLKSASVNVIGCNDLGCKMFTDLMLCKCLFCAMQMSFLCQFRDSFSYEASRYCIDFSKISSTIIIFSFLLLRLRLCLSCYDLCLSSVTTLTLSPSRSFSSSSSASLAAATTSASIALTLLNEAI